MGIVVRQSIKYSILSAFGSLVGALSVLFIYPLDIQQYGYANGINSLIIFAGPLFGFSCNAIITRFSHSKDLSKIQVLKISILFTLVSTLVMLLILFGLSQFADNSLQTIGFDTRFFKQNMGSIILGGICLAFIALLTSLSATFQRTVIPNLILNLGIKFIFPLMILGIYFHWFPAHILKYIISGYYLFALIALVYYVYRLNGFSTFFSEKISLVSIPKSVVQFTLISGFTGFANLMVNKLDIIALAGLGTMEDIGKYSIVFFIASFIEIPMAGISSISAPIIAKHFEKQELTELNLLLKKVSDTLFLAGVFLFTLILSVFQHLGELSGHEELFDKGLSVFYILGIAKLIDMVTSLNNQAISYSKSYHYNLYFVVISAISNVFLTYFLTKEMGIVGTAWSILISIILFNTLKFLLLYFKYKLNPFSFKTLKIVFVFFLQLLILQFARVEIQPILSILVNGGIGLISFMILLKWINPLPDWNDKLFSKDGILKNILNIKYIRKNLGL